MAVERGHEICRSWRGGWRSQPPKTAVAGTREHYCGKQESMTNGESKVSARVDMDLSMLFVLVVASGSAFHLDQRHRHLARTHWALVSAWPANATVSFLSAQFRNLRIRIYWHQRLSHPIHDLATQLPLPKEKMIDNRDAVAV